MVLKVPGREQQISVLLGAFGNDGKILWKVGSKGIQSYRSGSVAIHDMDNDRQTENICFFHEQLHDSDSFSFQCVTIQILDGKTGQVEKQKIPETFSDITGEGLNWLYQRILIANFRDTEKPQDFIVKLGKTIVAFNNNLKGIMNLFQPLG